MKSIRPKAVDMRSLNLSPEEGFVLSRVDGVTTVKNLVALTGLDETRVFAIVERLAQAGAVEVEGASPTSDAAPFQAELLAFLDDGSAHDDNSTETTETETTEGAGADVDEETVVEREKASEGEYRKIFETVFRPMTKDQRIAEAARAAGAHLLALCLDPDPQVIYAVLSNSRAGLDHARLVAFHHRTSVGLEMVAKRAEIVADAIVQRRLLRNPQLPATILNRIASPKPILEAYKLAIERDIPERTRTMMREILRKKFMLSSSDERAALLLKTEARCLVLLSNCSLDAHATQILCSKQTYSTLFIQNVARWSATPPALLSHLLKNAVVRRNQGLRKMLLKHANTPSDIKRNLS
ncbi:MAG TPA: hypothetical protein VM580_13450 [Labilithrix sp.]|nr:hypothetical protein [Labilithrix sp.]